MDLLTIIILSLMVLYVLYVILERVLINKMRKSFKYVIHVNGTRGKSTTTRLIDAGFRACGYKVYSKTTGTFPTVINTKNESHVIKRLGNANIREQMKTMFWAYKEKAEVLVIECMAINPELQYVCEHEILNSDVVVITNVRPDHLGDMGDNLEEIAKALSNTIPKKGIAIIDSDEYLDIFESKAKNTNSQIVISKPYVGASDFGTFKDNIANALEVARVLNLDVDKFYDGFNYYKHDDGAYKEIKYNDTLFMNALSVNDPESILIVYDKATQNINKEEVTILLNTRDDRATRTLQYIEMLPKMKCKKIIVMSDNAYRLYRKHNIDVIKYTNNNDLLEEKYIFATGNIAGRGEMVLKWFEEVGEVHES